MARFFDREEERASTDLILSDLESGSSCILWIEGQSGAGKSALLDYAIRKTNATIIPFDQNTDFYKCNRGTMGNNFSCISHLLVTIENRFPKDFSSKMESYMRKFSKISLRSSILEVLVATPLFKWANALKSRTEKRQISSMDSAAQRLLDSHIENCLTEALYEIIAEQYIDKPILICIDDVIYIDQNSLNVFLNLIRKVKSRREIVVSFILTSRDYFSTEDKVLYIHVEELFRRTGLRYEQLTVRNFTRNTTFSFFKSQNREILVKEASRLFEVTKGNLQEITQLIKLSDDQINSKLSDGTIESEKRSGFQPVVSQSIVFEVIAKHPNSGHILFVLCFVAQPLTEDSLFLLCSMTQHFRSRDDFLNNVRVLVDSNLLSLIRNSYYISHDSLIDITNSYFTELGSYGDKVKLLCEELFVNAQLSAMYTANFRLQLILTNLSKNLPELGIQYYRRMRELPDVDEAVTPTIGTLLSEIYLSVVPINKKEPYLVEGIHILRYLMHYGLLNQAKELGIVLWESRASIPSKDLIKFTFDFIRILVDIGDINQNENMNAQQVLKVIKSEFNEMTNADKIESLLVENFYFERTLSYDSITENNRLIQSMLESVPASQRATELQIKALRNMGLVGFHADLEETYKKAISLCDSLEPGSKSKALKGTCYSNLGTSYFYQSNLKLALSNYEKALELLEEVQSDPHRVLNNIAGCCIILGDLEKANSYIIKAKETKFRGVFEEISIDLNYALLQFELGNESEAQEIVGKYIDHYQNGKLETPDTWVYSAAMCLGGYFRYRKNEFLGAIELYKRSKFHEFRFANDQQMQKRDAMVDNCLKEENLPTVFGDKFINYIDNDPSCENLFRKSFDVQIFAYYIV